MSALFISMFTLGLVTSVHCVSMCGPMVVTYAVKGEEGGRWFRKLIPNGVYQVAKIASYVLVGLVLGAIGGAFNLDGLRPYVMLAAGLFMIILGLGMTGRFPWAQRLTPRPPKFLMTALSRTRRKAASDAAEGSSSLATPLTFGLLTGLFPCAPLQGAQLTAAATGSALTGGLAMLAFGLGTAPLMLGFGTASSFLPKAWKQRMTVVLALVVMVFGLVFINRGLMLVGSPVTAQSIRVAVLGGPAAPSATTDQYSTGGDGVVEIPLTIRNTQFIPAQVRIPSDKAVRLIVDRQEDNACSDQIALPQLGIVRDLKPFATTVIDVPATPEGSYTLTCGMGMMSGRLLVGAAAGTSSPAVSPLRIVAIMLVVALVGWGVLVLRRRPTPSTAGRGASKPAPGHPKQGEAAPAGVLGFSPVEVVVGGGVLTAAIVAGLAFGGFFAR